MATADRPWWQWPALAAPIVVAVAVVSWQATTNESAPSGSAAGPSTSVLQVTAESPYHFESIAEMGAASDLVVVGEVVTTERGRLVGDPDAGGVISRVVTLRVAEVVRDRDHIAPTTVLVEEEGWLPDGTPIVVNGVAPSEAGDSGLWFLDEVASGEAPIHIVISSQGRFLVDDDGTVRGGDPTDPLVIANERRPLAELVAEAR